MERQDFTTPKTSTYSPFHSPSGPVLDPLQTETPMTTVAMLDVPNLEGGLSPRNNRNIDFRVLTPITLLAIVYMTTSGGPIGTDAMVGIPGPLVSTVTTLMFVLLYAWPFSYLCAELCTAFPDDGGIAIWVQNAFGDFWGFQAGYWMWVSLIVACTVLPAGLYSEYASIYGSVDSKLLVFVIKALLALLVALPTILGSRTVGKTSIASFTLMACPVILFCVVALANAKNWGDLGEVRHKNLQLDEQGKLLVNDGPTDIDWKSLVTGIFYNYDGIAMVSVFGGEVANPARTYSFAIFVRLAMHVLCDLIPLMCLVVYGSPHWSVFDGTGFEQAAASIGDFYRDSIRFGSICSMLGFYVTAMFAQVYLVSGMSSAKLLPSQLSKRNAKFRTPHMAVVFGIVIVIILIASDIPHLDTVSSAVSCLGQLLVIAAGIRLRFTLPDARRPTKVPGGPGVLCALMVFPALVLCFTIYTSLSTTRSVITCVIILAVGLVFGIGYQRYHRFKEFTKDSDRLSRAGSATETGEFYGGI